MGSEAVEHVQEKRSAQLILEGRLKEGYNLDRCTYYRNKIEWRGLD
jgi:hypothetical protein